MRLQSTSWISPSDQMHSWKPIREEKQRASHTPDSTVFSVCDRVHDVEGDDTSVRTEWIVQPALQ